MEKYIIVVLSFILLALGLVLIASVLGLLIYAIKAKKKAPTTEQETIYNEVKAKTPSKNVCMPKVDNTDYTPYNFSYYKDKERIEVLLDGVDIDEQYTLARRDKDPCNYYHNDCLRLVAYDINKLDNVIEKLIEHKPNSYHIDEKIYIRIQNENNSIAWIVNNKIKTYECRDNAIEFVFGFDTEKYENVFYNITQDCFTMIYDTYAGYGMCDDAATYYDVHEKDYSFDNESELYTYGRELHKLFKRDYRYPLDDIRLAFLSEYFEREHKFSFDFEKACDSHYEFNEAEFEKI